MNLNDSIPNHPQGGSQEESIVILPGASVNSYSVWGKQPRTIYKILYILHTHTHTHPPLDLTIPRLEICNRENTA